MESGNIMLKHFSLPAVNIRFLCLIKLLAKRTGHNVCTELSLSFQYIQVKVKSLALRWIDMLQNQH